MLRRLSSTQGALRPGGLHLRRIHRVYRVKHIDIAPHTTPTPRSLQSLMWQAANATAPDPDPKHAVNITHTVPKEQSANKKLHVRVINVDLIFRQIMWGVGVLVVARFAWKRWKDLRARMAALRQVAGAVPDLDALPDHGPALARHLQAFMPICLPTAAQEQAALALQRSDPAAIRAACERIHAVLQENRSTMDTLVSCAEILLKFANSAPIANSDGDAAAESADFSDSDAPPSNDPPLLRG